MESVLENGLQEELRSQCVVVANCLDSSQWDLSVLAMATLLEGFYDAAASQPLNEQVLASTKAGLKNVK
eukprot:8347131-Alexandrium_andersonii.AAC.1